MPWTTSTIFSARGSIKGGEFDGAERWKCPPSLNGETVTHHYRGHRAQLGLVLWRLVIQSQNVFLSDRTILYNPQHAGLPNKRAPRKKPLATQQSQGRHAIQPSDPSRCQRWSEQSFLKTPTCSCHELAHSQGRSPGERLQGLRCSQGVKVCGGVSFRK